VPPWRPCHGGGLTVAPANLESFRLRLNQLAREALKPDQLLAPLRLDAEVGLEEINLPCLASLSQLKPTGQGNPPVQFVARRLEHQRPLQRMGADKQHVKMWVSDGPHCA